MEIKSLAETGFETIADAFAAAFATYDVQISAEELRSMLRRRGFDPALSFAAFDRYRDRIAAFTLNGIGSFGGVRTAYDTGTGTLPEYRSQGLATRIFEESLPALRAASVEQYLLEVLQHNTAAVSVYRKLGFEVARKFNYFRGEPEAHRRRGACDGNVSEVQPTAWGGGVLRVASDSIFKIKSCAPDFWDFTPSWQNSFEAIERAISDFVIVGAYDGDRLVGYAIFEPAAGDITQIAVARDHRRKGIGSALLGEVLRLNRAPGVKCINTEIGRDDALAGFLQAHGIEHAGRQFEMIKKL